MTESVKVATELHDELADSQIDEKFALAAFPVLLEHRLGRSSPVASPAIRIEPSGASEPQDDAQGESSVATALAARLRLPIEQLEDIYDFSVEPIALVVSPGRLASAVAHATEQIALLVVAARQAESSEAWTTTSDIRSVCQDYARFDSSNFAGTLTSMHQEFAFRGSGRNREVRLTRPGWEKASALLSELGS